MDAIGPKHARAISALVGGARTLADAAALAGVAERSIKNWLAMPVFRAALAEAQDGLIDAAVRTAAADCLANHDVLRAIRDDAEQPVGARVKAAAVLDGSLLRWSELRGVQRRITDLELALAALEADT